MRLLSLTFIFSIILSLYAHAFEQPTLKKQSNRFIRATVGYPDSYSAAFEGLTLFIIAPHGAFPWDITDERPAEYYAVSLISPFLTSEGKKKGRENSVTEIAEATAHALGISHKMSVADKTSHPDCGLARCAAISLKNESKFLYQVFLKFGPKAAYTISAFGRLEKAQEMQKIVTLMSRNISPYTAGNASR